MSDDDLFGDWRVPAPPAGLVAGVLERVESERASGAATRAGAVEAVDTSAGADTAAPPVELPEARVRRRGRSLAIGGTLLAAAASIAIAVSTARREGDRRVAPVGADRVGTFDGAGSHPDDYVTLDGPQAVRGLPNESLRAAFVVEIQQARAERLRADAIDPARRDLTFRSSPTAEPAEIAVVLALAGPRLDTCFEVASEESRALGGTIDIDLDVDTERGVGTLLDQVAVSRDDSGALARDPAFARCLVDMLRALRLPEVPTSGSIAFTHRFRFERIPEDVLPHSPPPPALPLRFPRPPTAAELTAQAMTALRAGEPGRAIALAELALERDPTHQAAFLAAGLAGCAAHDESRAIINAREVPDGPRAMIIAACKREGLDIEALIDLP